MDALYDFLPVPSANAEDTTPRLYPKIVSKGTITFEKLTEQIANHSGLTKGTILAVMDETDYSYPIIIPVNLSIIGSFYFVYPFIKERKFMRLQITL